MNEALQSKQPLILPINPMEAKSDAETAPVVTIETGTNEKVTMTIPVEKSEAGTGAVIMHTDGTKEIVRTSTIDKTGISLSVNNGTTLKIMDNTKIFNDTKNHWAAEAVTLVTSRGIFNGTSADTFTPDIPTTRGMFVKALHNLESNPTHNFMGALLMWRIASGMRKV